MTAEFVDTNILIYAHDAAAGGKYYVALELIERLALQETGALSTQVLMELYSTLTRKLRMPAEEAEDILLRLEPWPLHQPNHAHLIRASQLHRQHQISWWDALIVTSALELDCDTLWTEDLQDGRKFESLTVRNPFA